MKKYIGIFSIGLLIISSGSLSYGKDTAAKGNIKTAKLLEQISSRYVSKTKLGDAMAKETLRFAVKKFRAGDIKNNTVKFDILVTVKELPSKYPNDMPDPCFETCLEYGRSTALSCYSNCNAPSLPE